MFLRSFPQPRPFLGRESARSQPAVPEPSWPWVIPSPDTWHWSVKTNLDLTLVNHCHPVQVPRFKSTFDLYNPNGSQAYPTATTPIIARDVADTEGRTYVATLRFDSLGTKAKWRRAVSKKHRVLYVGCLPSMEQKAWIFGYQNLVLFDLGPAPGH